ncbi:MAG TPA: tail fiber protein [Bryobacteraceae bacterium]|nr:tail fiber protein [Bryobacteraceae bacterium]
MSEPFLGQLMLVPYDFAPKGWALCNGQLLPIAQNSALFSLLGVTYGGNGTTNFALPDLRGRVPISSGQGPGLANYVLGEPGGEESITLTTPEIPAHTHAVACYNGDAETSSPVNNLLANSTAYASTPDAAMAATMIGSSGENQPHGNMQPYLPMNWIIALAGIFPSRS